MNPNIEGIYEACIGVIEPISMIQYWEQFGYRIGQIGELAAPSANKLYGVNSCLKSIRLYHQDADHGLIRLMIWENPINDGLQMNPMKVKGNRWITTLTSDLLNISNSAEQAAADGLTIEYIYPQWGVIYQTQKGDPFVTPSVGVRVMLLLQPLTRQVLFQRVNYTVPHYGRKYRVRARRCSL